MKSPNQETGGKWVLSWHSLKQARGCSNPPYSMPPLQPEPGQRWDMGAGGLGSICLCPLARAPPRTHLTPWDVTMPVVAIARSVSHCPCGMPQTLQDSLRLKSERALGPNQQTSGKKGFCLQPEHHSPPSLPRRGGGAGWAISPLILWKGGQEVS